MLWILAIAIAVALFLLVGLTFRVLERRLTYFPRPLAPGTFEELVSTLPPGDEEWREVSFSTVDEETLQGWFGRPRDPEGWVLWNHGNAGSVVHRWQDFHRLVRIAKLAVLIYDYRGYGRSSGRPDEAGLYRDSRAAWDALVDLGANPDEIVLLGRSLGGAVAIELAADRPVRGLVLESTFTSFRDMARRAVSPFPAHWFARNRFPSEARISRLDVPILLFHGTQDTLVPFRHGERLAAAARPGRLEFVPVEGAGHNDVSETLGRAYFARVRAFVTGGPPRRGGS
jgi:pimeloyl-ACP methyl ester carboxylesterase